jgi:hypothetical protein
MCTLPLNSRFHLVVLTIFYLHEFVERWAVNNYKVGGGSNFALKEKGTTTLHKTKSSLAQVVGKTYLHIMYTIVMESLCWREKFEANAGLRKANEDRGCSELNYEALQKNGTRL